MVKWDADKDRQLLLGVLAHVDIKIGKDLTEHLAAVIGEGKIVMQLLPPWIVTDGSRLGCTPKAVHRRIEKLQSAARPNEQPTLDPPSPDTAYRVKTPQAAGIKVKTKGQANLKTKGRKRGRSEEEIEETNKKTRKGGGEGEKEDDSEI